MIAVEIEAIFADVMSAKLPAEHVFASQSRTDTLDDDDYGVIVECAPEEVWLRDAAGRARGWRLSLSVHVLGYTEAIKADAGVAFRALCQSAGAALRALTDEELTAAIEGSYALSGFEEADNADRGAEEGYDRWTATCNLYVTETQQESAS